MDIKPIKTKADHRAALKEIESLMRARPNTPEGDKLNALVTLVEAYERKHSGTPAERLIKQKVRRGRAVRSEADAVRKELDAHGIKEADIESAIRWARAGKVDLPVSKKTGGLAPGIDPLSNKSLYDAADDDA